MQRLGTSSTCVYIDGQNFHNSVKDAFHRDEREANFQQLFKSVVENNTHAPKGTTRYYTGLAISDEDRSQQIAFLNSLQCNGIETFANELQNTPAGGLREVGIDLKLASDMVWDYLTSNPQIPFQAMIVSNDKDYEPAVQLLNELAKLQKREIKIYSLVVGSEHTGLVGTERIELQPNVFARNSMPERSESKKQADRAKADPYATIEDFVTKGRAELAKDPTNALDARAHAGRTLDTITPRKGPLSRGTGIFLDVNSLRKTGDSLKKPDLDVNLVKLATAIAKQTTTRVKIAQAYTSIHRQAKNLDETIFIGNLCQELQQQRVEPITSQYTYQIRGGREVALEKKHTTKLLAGVILGIMRGKIDHVVLVSDDKSLWPIAELAQKIGNSTNHPISVTCVGFDPRPIEKTHSIRLSPEDYLKHIDGKNRMQIARDQARTRRQNDGNEQGERSA